MGEYEANLAQQTGKINIGILRLHNIYGPGSPYDPARSQARSNPVPLIFSPDDNTKFVSMQKARKWLKAFLLRVTYKDENLRRINLHSPRAGFATNMYKHGVKLQTIMYHGRWKVLSSLLIRTWSFLIKPCLFCVSHNNALSVFTYRGAHTFNHLNLM